MLVHQFTILKENTREYNIKQWTQPIELLWSSSREMQGRDHVKKSPILTIFLAARALGYIIHLSKPTYCPRPWLPVTITLVDTIRVFDAIKTCAHSILRFGTGGYEDCASRLFAA